MGSSGVWDPSLVFVLFSASVVYFIHHFQMLRSKWTAPILSSQLLIPSRKDLTPSLIIGSGIFGIGWGLVGLCPGPGLVGAGAGIPSALIWSFAAIAGIKLYHNLPKLKNQ